MPEQETFIDKGCCGPLHDDAAAFFMRIGRYYFFA